MIDVKPTNFDGAETRWYLNLVPVGAFIGAGDGTNSDLASNQLVQFFLRKFFTAHPELLPRSGVKGSEFLLDGIVGDQTLKGILVFQDFVRRRKGVHIVKDSRVSVAIHAVQGLFVPGMGNTVWTIHALNLVVSGIMKSKDPTSITPYLAFSNLHLDSEIKSKAPQLHAELNARINKSAA